MAHDAFGTAAEQCVLQTAVAVRADDNQIRLPLTRCIGDLVPWSDLESLKAHFGQRAIAFRFLVNQRLHQGEATPEEVSDAWLEDLERLTRFYEPPSDLPASRQMAVQTTRRLEGFLNASSRSVSAKLCGLRRGAILKKC